MTDTAEEGTAEDEAAEGGTACNDTAETLGRPSAVQPRSVPAGSAGAPDEVTPISPTRNGGTLVPIRPPVAGRKCQTAASAE
ncbi:hypothetical protein rosag_18700 [Roseisolibacter agri]|uniref:Uncharacterized protein n=1 Tax=Roseisolibacter agri TaxID=2014610 RepID=A0AA37Q630_9BACT|nr:hypothetical protein rosag_18700 [Roseisolibacter agri]